MLGVMLVLGMIGAVVFAADSAYGGGPAIGIGFGGGGGGPYGGGGYGGYYGGGRYYGGGYGGYYGGSGVRFGVSVPLSEDGNVRLGVGNGGYYPPNYYRNHDYPRGGYYYGGNYNYQDGAGYGESTPPAPPPVPTAGQVGRMSDGQLAGLLRAATEEYSRELDGYTNGETWKKYFKLTEILEIAKKSQPNPPDAAVRTTVAEVVKRMDSAAKNAEYDAIAKPWGFKTLQVGLREYALPLKERLGHLLSANLQKIGESLDGVTTGEGWKKHLQIEELGKLAENAGANDASQGKRLEKILAKFDAVAQNSQYQVIAELDGFAATRADLQRYINALQADQPGQTPSPPPPPAVDTVRSF
jgi:hypothetical protein